MPAREVQKSPNYLRIGLQSALAAVFCLGMPAGLLLWLILLQKINHAPAVQPAIDFLRVNGLYSVFILVLSSMMWSYLLGRISGYRQWWWIALASALSILGAWFSPLANVDGILYEYNPSLPIHLNYAASMVGLIGTVTLFIGLSYGLVLRSIKAALTLGLTTSFVSILILLITIFVFDSLGIRVGTGNLAMVRVTAVDLVTSALAGGMILGLGFSWFVRGQKHRVSS